MCACACHEVVVAPCSALSCIALTAAIAHNAHHTHARTRMHARMQLLILTFRTPAKRLLMLGWCIAPGETADSYTALLEWAACMGGTAVTDGGNDTWSVRETLESRGFVMMSDWGSAVRSAVASFAPHARHR